MDMMDPVHFTKATRLLLLGLLALLATLAALAMLATGARAGWTVQQGVSYANGSPADPSLNQLDLYLPDSPAQGPRPVVIWVHGGGWMNGDKGNQTADKAKLFTDAGYILASINYRLSPVVPPTTFDPARIRYPEHPRDVASAIDWVGRNISGYGGDPDAMILLGHSAGAHLVSLVGSNPAWLKATGASLRQVVGVVSLDAGAMDVVDSATQTTPQPTDNNYVIWNAFGTPSEEASDPRWLEASPTTWGDPTDPRSLLITQSSRVLRIIDNQKMATALGQDPAAVLTLPLTHEEINRNLGDAADTTGETEAVMSFIAGRLASRVDPRVSIRKRPAKVIRTGRKASGKPRKRKVSFVFRGSGDFEGFQCRLDRAAFKACRSPRKYTVGTGGHSFRVRPLYPSGRAGAEKLVKFRVKPKSLPRR